MIQLQSQLSTAGVLLLGILLGMVGVVGLFFAWKLVKRAALRGIDDDPQYGPGGYAHNPFDK